MEKLDKLERIFEKELPRMVEIRRTPLHFDLSWNLGGRIYAPSFKEAMQFIAKEGYIRDVMEILEQHPQVESLHYGTWKVIIPKKLGSASISADRRFNGFNFSNVVSACIRYGNNSEGTNLDPAGIECRFYYDLNDKITVDANKRWKEFTRQV